MLQIRRHTYIHKSGYSKRINLLVRLVLNKLNHFDLAIAE